LSGCPVLPGSRKPAQQPSRNNLKAARHWRNTRTTGPAGPESDKLSGPFLFRADPAFPRTIPAGFLGNQRFIISIIADQPSHGSMKRTKAAIAGDISQCQDEMDRLIEDMAVPFDKFFNDNDQSQQSVISEKRAAYLAAEKWMEALESELGSTEG